MNLLMKVTLQFVQFFSFDCPWRKKRTAAGQSDRDDATSPPFSFVFLSLKWSSNRFEKLITITIDVVSCKR